jgi:hypothetical protein
MLLIYKAGVPILQWLNPEILKPYAPTASRSPTPENSKPALGQNNEGGAFMTKRAALELPLNLQERTRE